MRKTTLRLLHACGRLFRWKWLMFTSGALLLTVNQSCHTGRTRCYDAVPVDSVNVSQPRCYDMAEPPADTTKINPDENGRND